MKLRVTVELELKVSRRDIPLNELFVMNAEDLVFGTYNPNFDPEDGVEIASEVLSSDMVLVEWRAEDNEKKKAKTRKAKTRKKQ